METHKSAIAELDDFASAFASVTVDTEGGGIAGFRAVSYENADGSGSSALELLGDQVVVPGSLTSRSLTVTDGSGNLIINGDFLSGDDRGWEYRGDDPPYFAKYSDESSGATDEDVVPNPYMFVFRNTDSGGVRSETFKVKPGDNLIASFDYGAGGSSPRDVSFRALFRFLDADGSWLDGRGWSDYSPSYSGVGWADRYSTTTTVPEGAAYCNVQFSRDPDTADDGTGFLTNLECRRREDGRTIIKPGSVTTEEIDTDDFNANGMAVFGGQLLSDNFESGVSGWSIRNDGSAEFDTIHLRDEATSAVRFFSQSSTLGEDWDGSENDWRTAWSLALDFDDISNNDIIIAISGMFRHNPHVSDGDYGTLLLRVKFNGSIIHGPVSAVRTVRSGQRYNAGRTFDFSPSSSSGTLKIEWRPEEADSFTGADARWFEASVMVHEVKR